MTIIGTFWGDDEIVWGDGVLEWVIPPNLEIIEYIVTSELPNPLITCLDHFGDPILNAEDWTFEIRVGRPGEPACITKTDGINATPGSIEILWSSGEMAELPVGNWQVDVIATETATSRRMAHSFAIRILAGVLPSGQA